MIEIDVGEGEVVRFLDSGKRAIERAIDISSQEVVSTVGTESARVSKRVGRSWRVRKGPGLTRRVVSEEPIAHLLAGGTRPHGPKKAKVLVFSINGEMVFARRVRGIKASHFDEHAIDRVESRSDEIVRRAVREVVDASR